MSMWVILLAVRVICMQYSLKTLKPAIHPFFTTYLGQGHGGSGVLFRPPSPSFGSSQRSSVSREERSLQHVPSVHWGLLLEAHVCDTSPGWSPGCIPTRYVFDTAALFLAHVEELSSTSCLYTLREKNRMVGVLDCVLTWWCKTKKKSNHLLCIYSPVL